MITNSFSEGCPYVLIDYEDYYLSPGIPFPIEYGECTIQENKNALANESIFLRCECVEYLKCLEYLNKIKLDGEVKNE